METIVTIILKPITCCECGVVFGMSEERKNRLLQSGENFFCTNGHPQHFTDKQSKEKQISQLKEQNESLECRIDICTHTTIHSIVSYRFWKPFDNQGINNIGHALELKESGLREIYGIGDVAINQINQYLTKKGLNLVK